MVRAAEPDIFDLGRINTRALDRGGDRECGEVVGSYACKTTAVPPYRGSDSGEDDSAAHSLRLSRLACTMRATYVIRASGLLR